MKRVLWVQGVGISSGELSPASLAAMHRAAELIRSHNGGACRYDILLLTSGGGRQETGLMTSALMLGRLQEELVGTGVSLPSLTLTTMNSLSQIKDLNAGIQELRRAIGPEGVLRSITILTPCYDSSQERAILEAFQGVVMSQVFDAQMEVR